MKIIDAILRWIQNVLYFLRHELYFYFKRITKKYYIIRLHEPGSGFFSNYWFVVSHIVFADKLKYIPVVDMKNYNTLYREDHPVNGEENAWFYYFENKNKISLEDIYNSKKFVLSEDKPLNKYGNRYSMKEYRFPTIDSINFFYPLIKQYISIRPEIIEEFKVQWKNSVGADKKSILGIHVRGTDMKNLQNNHIIPVDNEEYIRNAKEIIEKYEIDAVFIASDEKKVVQMFNDAFDEPKYKRLLVFSNSVYRNTIQYDAGKAVGIHDQKFGQIRENHKYLLGLEVLKDAWFLSKCNYLLCGHSNVTNVAIYWNNHQYKKVICLEHVDIKKEK